MKILLDSGFLYALADKNDADHAATTHAAEVVKHENVLLPAVVLPEVCYLIGSRLGHRPMFQFLRFVEQWQVPLVDLREGDLSRVAELLEQYTDSRLDFVDAAIIALAERLNVIHILTLDRRDFSIVRPRHCDYFELLP